MPVRPHEGLVVEASGEEALEGAQHGANIERGRRPAVHGAGHQPFVEFHFRGAQVGGAPSAFAHLHQRIRFFHASGQQATWPMQLERPTHHADAIGKQCGCQRVARMAGVCAAIEGEAQRTVAVYTATGGKTRTTHGLAPATLAGTGSVMPYTATIS